MRFVRTLVIFCLILACQPEKSPVVMYSNFNMVVTADDYGDRIDLKKGVIEYPDRLGYGDVHFGLDSAELKTIFASVPWNVLSGQRDIYVPYGGDGLRCPASRCEVEFRNGNLQKRVILTYCDYPDDAEDVRQLIDCIATIHRIVRRRSDVPPINLIEM